MARVVMAILALAVTIYAVADCARTPNEKIPGRIPKALILVLIMLFMPIGGLAWIVISRVAAAEANDGQVRPTVWSSPDSAVRVRRSTQPRTAPMAPDDDPEFLWKLEKELHRRRQENAQPQSEKPTGADPADPANDSPENAANQPRAEEERGEEDTPPAPAV